MQTQTQNPLAKEYFDWLVSLIGGDGYSARASFGKLLRSLHEYEFAYLIPKDRNRAEDGIDLRYRFAITHGYEDNRRWVMRSLDGPCSVLEMMIALAIRCEEAYMDDPHYGDRTGQWFWGMVTNLGLGGMTDNHFDEMLFDDIIETFLRREYEPDGTGGLFTVRDRARDLRDVEIWYQLCWYLDSIADY